VRNDDRMRMKIRHATALVLVLATGMIGVSSSAQEWNEAHPDPSATGATQIVHLSGSIKGIMETTAGGCTHGFSNHCPDGHTCGCLTAMAAKVSSPALGAGTANIFATIDNTSAFALGACAPVYAEFDITAKRDSPTFNAIGGMCFEPNGEAVFNGVMGLPTSSERFSTTGSVGYTGVLKCIGGLCGGSLEMALSFKGTAE
jgi:hypothetical protein